MEATCDTDAHAQAAYVTNGTGGASTVSNGDIVDEDMSDITDWTDSDAGTGDSSQVTFDSKSCMKLDSGANTGSIAFRTRDVGTYATRTVLSLNMYFDAIGTQANDDGVQVKFFNGTTQFILYFASDGFFIYNSTDGYVEVGTNLVVQDVWQQWSFDVDWTNKLVDVYLDTVSKANDVSCDQASATASGTSNFIQNSTTTANRITYIDWFKAGSDFGTLPETLQSYSGTDVTAGTYSLKGVATTGAVNKTLTRTVNYNLTGVTTLKFDMKTSHTGENIKIGLVDSGATTEVTPNQTGTGYQTNTIDLSAVSDANKDAITSYVITIMDAGEANTFYIDNFLESAGTGGGASFFTMGN